MIAFLATLAPTGVLIGILSIPAIVFALAVLAARYAILRLEHWITIIVFPAAWTSYEYVLSTVAPHGTAGSLAYTQTDVLPLVQIASVTGIWGITFVLTLVPAGIAFAWHFRGNKKRALTGLIIPFAVVLLTVVYGWARLGQPESEHAILVGLATTDESVQYFRTEQPQEALPVVEAYARRIAKLAAQGARVVVLPEKFVGISPSYRNDVFRILGEAARNNKVYIIAGLNQIGSSPYRNTAVIFSPAGQVLAEYDKMHLLPGFESDYQPGTRPVTFPVAGATAGVTICKDMDFPSLARQYGRAGAGILFVPAWDFVKDARLHARMAILRGVESGFAVARSAQQGLVTKSDHKGRVLVEDRSSRLPEVLVVGEIRPGPAHTIYSISGDWFAWLNLLFLVLILAAIAMRAAKTRTVLRAQHNVDRPPPARYNA